MPNVHYVFVHINSAQQYKIKIKVAFANGKKYAIILCHYTTLV